MLSRVALTALLASFISIGCGSHSGQSALQTVSAEQQSPFHSSADEVMFWKIMNDEVDVSQLKRTPEMRLAVVLRACLSDKLPVQLRMQILQSLLASKFSADLDQPGLEALFSQFTNDKVEMRLAAMKTIASKDAAMANMLRYVLSDTAHLKEFAAKNKSTAPATPSLPNDGKMEHNQ